MFRKAVSTIEGVKAGEESQQRRDDRADRNRRCFQLSAPLQPRGSRFYVAHELYP